MNRNWRAVPGIAALMLVAAIGCSKQKPPTPTPPPPEPPPPVEEPAEEVEQVAPPTEEDPYAWKNLEIEALNAHLAETGMIGDVYFDFDRYELRDDARERLARNAEFMKDNREFIFSIEGHCDERGTNDYNFALGDRRANAAQSYLMSLGVDGELMSTISYGEEQPQCNESTESCWQLNRRAHFVVTGKSAG